MSSRIVRPKRPRSATPPLPPAPGTSERMTNRVRIRPARLAVVIAALLAVPALGVALVGVAAASSGEEAAVVAPTPAAVAPDAAAPADPPAADAPSTGDDGGVGVDDGYIDPGASISPTDDSLPAIAKLNPALREALQRAAADASDQEVWMVVTSGWRSEAYQRKLLDDAIAEKGEAAARKLVSGPAASRHVTGDAVDIGWTAADDWLDRHGSDYGLCRIYANEPWHFELATTPGGECPPLIADASKRG